VQNCARARHYNAAVGFRKFRLSQSPTPANDSREPFRDEVRNPRRAGASERRRSRDLRGRNSEAPGPGAQVSGRSAREEGPGSRSHRGDRESPGGENTRRASHRVGVRPARSRTRRGEQGSEAAFFVMLSGVARSERQESKGSERSAAPCEEQSPEGGTPGALPGRKKPGEVSRGVSRREREKR